MVFSVNPADIMLAKDVNRCSTCFCLNSGREAWGYGMRCLIALNCINPNLGVAYTIKKGDVKKLNQFNGIKFKWYDPRDAAFFQYDHTHMYFWYNHRKFNIFTDNSLPETYKKIYGHDGYNIGHARQNGLAYLETFIKPEYRWNKYDDGLFLANNKGQVKPNEVSDEWKRQIEIANQKAKELKEYLEQMKE